jgi:hypothetical protein
LVKMDDPEVIHFLLKTEIIPLCLRIMESGSELSKTVATFIVQKVLLDEMGLQYVCATAERFYAVATVLSNMMELLTLNPSVRLLKHIVRCYLRLSDNLQAREALSKCLPSTLRDDTFAAALRDDVTVKKWLNQLLSVVGPGSPSPPPSSTSSLAMGNVRMSNNMLVGGSVGNSGGGGVSNNATTTATTASSVVGGTDVIGSRAAAAAAAMSSTGMSVAGSHLLQQHTRSTTPGGGGMNVSAGSSGMQVAGSFMSSSGQNSTFSMPASSS